MVRGEYTGEMGWGEMVNTKFIQIMSFATYLFMSRLQLRGAVAQSVRASGSQSEGRGFESLQLHQSQSAMITVNHNPVYS